MFRSRHEDWQLNACVNCYGPTLVKVADSYLESVEALAKTTADGEATLDLAILPIVYLYRQCLELTFKSLIDAPRQVDQTGSGYPKHHNLKHLWSVIKVLAEQHYGADCPAELDNIQPCVDEFDTHDPESAAFRYPTAKDGAANLTNITHINLGNLYETMERISSLLDCLTADLSAKLDYMPEN